RMQSVATMAYLNTIGSLIPIVPSTDSTDDIVTPIVDPDPSLLYGLSATTYVGKRYPPFENITMWAMYFSLISVMTAMFTVKVNKPLEHMSRVGLSKTTYPIVIIALFITVGIISNELIILASYLIGIDIVYRNGVFVMMVVSVCAALLFSAMGVLVGLFCTTVTQAIIVVMSICVLQNTVAVLLPSDGSLYTDYPGAFAYPFFAFCGLLMRIIRGGPPSAQLGARSQVTDEEFFSQSTPNARAFLNLMFICVAHFCLFVFIITFREVPVKFVNKIRLRYKAKNELKKEQKIQAKDKQKLEMKLKSLQSVETEVMIEGDNISSSTKKPKNAPTDIDVAGQGTEITDSLAGDNPLGISESELQSPKLKQRFAADSPMSMSSSSSSSPLSTQVSVMKRSVKGSVLKGDGVNEDDAIPSSIKSVLSISSGTLGKKKDLGSLTFAGMTGIPSSSTPDDTLTCHSPNSTLSLVNVNKFYGSVHALVDINMSMMVGHRVAVLGSTGSGKTTLMNMLNGEDSLSSGCIYTEGVLLSTHETKDHVMSIAQDNSVLLDDLSIKEHFMLYQEFQGITKGDASKKCDILGKSLQFSRADMKKRVKNISGGMKRRTCFGIAQTGTHLILTADEPLTGQDPKTKKRLAHLLTCIDPSRLLVFTTHDTDIVSTVASHLAFVFHGHLVLYCSLKQAQQQAPFILSFTTTSTLGQAIALLKKLKVRVQVSKTNPKRLYCFCAESKQSRFEKVLNKVSKNITVQYPSIHTLFVLLLNEMDIDSPS
ncbi:ABC transporter A like protein, partial [Aduncisulcus paluster]